VDALLPFTRDASVDHYLRVIENAAPARAHRSPRTAGPPDLSASATGTPFHDA
jgi:hypothetical protein